VSFIAKKGRALYHPSPVKTMPYAGTPDGLAREPAHHH
jgi:hypothetical protein